MCYTDATIEQTGAFRRWIEAIGDRKTRSRILVRIDRLAHGNPGHHRSLGNGILELKLDFGPGYRIYVARPRRTLLLLAGGDKSKQSRDIELARALLASYDEIEP
jgi:putative addiction module killer protein